MGGLLIYFSEKYMEPILDINLCTPNLECISMRVKMKNAHDIIFTAVYRAPDGSLIDSLHEFDEYYANLNINQSSDILVVGVWNVDMLKNSLPKRNLDNTMKRYNLTRHKFTNKGNCHNSDPNKSYMD